MPGKISAAHRLFLILLIRGQAFLFKHIFIKLPMYFILRLYFVIYLKELLHRRAAGCKRRTLCAGSLTEEG